MRQRDRIRQRLAQESGPDFRATGHRVALAYPSPYRVGMSSLGYQWVLSLLREAGLGAERVFLPDDLAEAQRRSESPLSYEQRSPLSAFPVVAVSLAYELELAGLIQLLQLAGIPPLAADRGPHDPRILLGGPLTFSNPLPAGPFVDAMLVGEADETVVPAVWAAFGSSREAWLDSVAALPGGFVPERGGALPAPAGASDQLLPARSLLITPNTELASMFLIEAERGCHRQCTFCVMRRSEALGGMRRVSPERVLSLVPKGAPKVGLVGAAVSDHPELVRLLDALVRDGKGIGVSSLRADRVARRPEIARLLRASGARTLTVASDAASGRLRKQIAKGTREQDLLRCAELVREHRFALLKVYMMLGLPGETDDDIDELIDFSLALAGPCRVALGVAPFVPKHNTPLAGTPWAGIKVVERRIARLRRGLRGRVELRPTSPKWAWVEAALAAGDAETGLAVLEAVRGGGRFADWRRALAQCQTPAEPCSG